jgi:hypothetical protein
MPISDKKRISNNRYRKARLAQLNIRIPKKLAADFNEKLLRTGCSKAAFVKSAIQKFLKGEFLP